ncbi:hypothetical protein NP493_1065g01034 [Ridgeia piscesae]|uniref:N-acetylgalactosaminide beta-1,3-galactosyltransferase n=1 Tax=Ridgeia piscesae TaxID=27915 RepID=A0AAD9KHW8_RIDPI|nr:hypothetical protein NP493_1065g01034 [Ridgeia piscesae]
MYQDKQVSDMATPVLYQDKQVSDTASPVLYHDKQVSDTASPGLYQDKQVSDTASPVLYQDKQVSDTATPVLDQDKQFSGTATPVLYQDKQVSDTATPVLYQDKQFSDTATPVLYQDKQFSDMATPVLYQDKQVSDMTTPVLYQGKQSQWPVIDLLHERWPVTGAWTILPVLSSILASRGSQKWLFISDVETRLNVTKLLQNLSGFNHSERLFIGRGLYDKEHTIIHHFNFPTPPLAYPDFAAGFLMSLELVKHVAERLSSVKQKSDFSIDVKYELALYIHDKGEGVPLTDVAFLCTTESKPECATTYTHTFPDCTPLYHIHLPKTDTSPSQTPLNHRHLSIADTCPLQAPLYHMHLPKTDTSPSQTPLHHRHLSIADISPSQTPLHYRHLAISDTSPLQTPLYHIHLPKTDTSSSQTPLHRRHLSITDTSPSQTLRHRRHFSITDNSPPQTPLTPHIKLTWGRQTRNIEYYSHQVDDTIPTIDLGIPNTEGGHCAKTHAILTRVHHRPGMKWLIIVDDDTLLSVPRLRRLLACYDPTEPVALGERYGYAVNTGQGYDYITGGGGMVFSQAAVHTLVEGNDCRCGVPNSPDDMHLGMCLKRFHIPLTHSPLFHQARPADYSPGYLSSQLPVSFHKHWNCDPYKEYAQWLAADDEPVDTDDGPQVVDTDGGPQPVDVDGGPHQEL